MERVHFPPYQEQTAILLNQLNGAILVAYEQSMMRGFGDESVLLIPVRRPAMQVGELLRKQVLQAPIEHVGEEMMIAIPPSFVIQ